MTVDILHNMYCAVDIQEVHLRFCIESNIIVEQESTGEKDIPTNDNFLYLIIKELNNYFKNSEWFTFIIAGSVCYDTFLSHPCPFYLHGLT